MPRRVAITGLGAIASIGANAIALWDAVRAGRCGIGPITTVPTDRLKTRLIAEIAAFDPAPHFNTRRLSMLDRASQLAVVAGREAWSQAAPAVEDDLRAGVVLAATIGHETFDQTYNTFYGERSNHIPPFTVPRVMPNAPASAISMEFGLRGPSFSVASACASSNHAIGLAFQMVRSGMLDVAVTGGADASVVVGVIKGWEGLRVLSADGCRPFSRDRSGLVIGEGAGILVLEHMDRARARGAICHAELVGFGMSADAGNITAPDARGAAAAMSAALADAGLQPGQIDYVNAHGTGTRLNDATETLALRSVFGRLLDRFAVSSTKSMLGHCMTASGALEAVVTAMALRDGVLPPTMGFREHDPECDIDCVPNASRAASPEFALSNSFAFGGMNAVLALRRADP